MPRTDDGHARIVRIIAGRVAVRARLLATPTADRIWAALPLFSTAELWGGEVYFETPLECGRERGARLIVAPGEIVFSPDRGVIGLPFGRTPISKGGESRLWSPSNVWAVALDPVDGLGAVRAGERVAMRAVAEDGD